MVLLAWPLVFWLVGFLAGWFLLQAFCCLFFPFLVPFCIPLVYFWESCSLLLNILLLSKKKKKKKTVPSSQFSC